MSHLRHIILLVLFCLAVSMPVHAITYTVSANHDKGGLVFLPTNETLRSGSTFELSEVLTDDNYYLYIRPVTLTGYELSVTFPALSANAKKGKVEIRYTIDISNDAYFFLHPSPTLSNLSIYFANNPQAVVDNWSDAPKFAPTTSLSDFGYFRLERVSALVDPVQVKVAHALAYSCDNEDGVTLTFTVPAETPIYHIYLQGKGYLRMKPDDPNSTTSTKATESGLDCFNLTSRADEAENFLFWSADSFVEQSETAQNTGVAAVTHDNEYYIIPQSSLGYYDQEKRYETLNESAVFGQLILGIVGLNDYTETDVNVGIGLVPLRDYALTNTVGYQTYTSFPWMFAPVSRFTTYHVTIEGADEGEIKYAGNVYHNGDDLQGFDITANNLRVRPISGTHYTVDVTDDAIQVKYITHKRVMSLDEIEEGHLYTVRSYIDRGYWAQNTHKAYNKLRDEVGVVLVGTYSDDVTYQPAAIDYQNTSLLWSISATSRVSESGIPQYFMENQSSGRFMAMYYTGTQNDNYSFLQTQMSLSPQYGIGILPGEVNGTFKFVSEASHSLLATVNENSFIYVNSLEGIGSEGWDAFRTNYAYATPENAHFDGYLNYRGFFSFADAIYFHYTKNDEGILEQNPEALLWVIEDTGLTTCPPYLVVNIVGLDEDPSSDDLSLQVWGKGSARATVYDDFVNHTTRVLTPYQHASADASVDLTASLHEESDLAAKYTVTVEREETTPDNGRYTFNLVFKPTEEEGIEAVAAETAPARYYDLFGHLLAAPPARGLFLRAER